MWLAGQETTSNTLAWMVIYLMTNPKAQESLQLELTKVVGSDRIVTLDDKMNLPYVNAVVAETQRLCNLLPSNVPHRLTEDVNFHGYSLKADTIVIPQISSVLYDETIFPEPLKFKPERFLDSAGKFQTKPELIPFSVGKRACLGEGLARLELYLFAANLFNQFEVWIFIKNVYLGMNPFRYPSYLQKLQIWSASWVAPYNPNPLSLGLNFDINLFSRFLIY